MAVTNDIGREFAGEHFLPVQRVLGKRTLAVVCSIQKATAAILSRPTNLRRRLPDYERLTRWRTLTKFQRSELCAILTDPKSYWNGWPIYRRFPPRPGFAVQLKGSNDDAVVLIDLHNPGWEFFCGDEEYWGFNFAGPRLAALAKGLFADYASDNSKSVWKKGAVESLEGAAATARYNPRS